MASTNVVDASSSAPVLITDTISVVIEAGIWNTVVAVRRKWAIAVITLVVANTLPD
jgi:hypothetical protein